MKIGIVGASGAVGRQMVEDLSTRDFLIEELRLFASPRSAGQEITFRGENLCIAAFSIEGLRGLDVVMMSAGSDFSRQWAEAIVQQGITVIDNSSAWRMDSRFSLVVPEVNGDLLKRTDRPTIWPNANCSTIQLVVTLKPLQDAFGLRGVQVASYQSVSGAGQKGIEELIEQSQLALKAKNLHPHYLPRSIAFNLIPAIDRFDEDGHCYEEHKIIHETAKILDQENLEVIATTVRVPTFRGHGEAVVVQLASEISRQQALEVFGSSPGIKLYDGGYEEMVDLSQIAGDASTHVMRVRLPLHQKNRSSTLCYWNVSDNLCKGAASNSVQICEALAAH